MITKDTAKPLFLVSYTEPSNVTIAGVKQPDYQYTSYMTQEGLDHISRWGRTIKHVDPVGVLWPKNAIVEHTGSSSPYRCYTEANYLVSANVELDEADFAVLRAQGCFMGGQEVGTVCGYYMDKGMHFYKVRSVCDSGD